MTRADTLRVQIRAGSGAWFDVASVAADSTSIVVHYTDPSVGTAYTARARTESGTLGLSAWVESSPPLTIVAPILDYATADYGAEYT